MDLIDLSELEQHFIISSRIEDEYLKSINSNEVDDFYVCKICHHAANKFQGQLRQYAFDRAIKVASNQKNVISRNPDSEQVLQGLEQLLEMAEGHLSEFNINPEIHTNSEAIYWEAFRDYFDLAVTELDFDFN